MKSEKVLSRADRLEKMREKLARTDTSTGSAGFLRLQDGRNVIRILPEVGTMEFFFQCVGKHVLPPDGKKWFYCPKFTSEGELDCPICNYVDELYKAGDKASKKLASDLRVKRSFWMNAIDRNHENLGVQIFTPGVTVFNAISSMISDPDYGDIFDLADGIDLIIEKSGQKLETEYNVKPKRSSSPLHEDQEIVEKWLKQARDLSMVELSDDKDEDAEISKGHAVYVLPFDRLKDEFDEVSDDDEDDEDEDDEPVSRKSAPATTKRKVSKPEDDEDEAPVRKKVSKSDDEDEDDEPVRRKAKAVEEDDDEEEAPVRKKVSKSEPEDDDEEDEEDEDEEVDREITSRRLARRRPR